MADNAVSFPLSDRLVKEDGSDTVPWVNRELIPLLRQMRAAINGGALSLLSGLITALANGTGGIPDGVRVSSSHATPTNRNLFQIDIVGLGNIFEIRTNTTLATCAIKCNAPVTVTNSSITLSNNAALDFQGTGGTIQGQGAGNGICVGTSSAQKIGKWGSTPVVQPVLATGAGHTVDDVIAMLQSNGECRQV